MSIPLNLMWHYPKGKNARPTLGSEQMLRLYFLQQWFNRSDPGLEDALYNSPVLRLFAGIDLGCEPIPDATIILNFRDLLEKHDLGRSILNVVNDYLARCGVRISTGTIVDATIIHVPNFDQERWGKRDPGMHRVKRGDQWYFGMKAYVGVDSKKASYTPRRLRRLRSTNRRSCRSYCRATSERCGATQPIRAGREDASQGPTRTGMISHRADTSGSSTGYNYARTAPRRRSGPRSSICFES